MAKREPFIPGIKADAQLAVLNNEAGRQAEHKRHLDELGFPEYVEPDFMRHAPVSYDDPCNPTPSRIVNQAGQDLGDANREDSPHHSMYEYKPAKKIKKEFIQAIVKEQADEIFLNKVDNVSDQTKKFDTTKIGSQATYATETAPSSLPTGAVSHSTYKDGVETSVYGPQGASAKTREKAGGAGPYITRRTTFKPTGTGTDTGTSTGTDAVGSAGYYKKLGEQYKTEQSKDEKFMDFSMDKNMIKSIVKEQADGIFISKKPKPKVKAGAKKAGFVGETKGSGAGKLGRFAKWGGWGSLIKGSLPVVAFHVLKDMYRYADGQTTKAEDKKMENIIEKIIGGLIKAGITPESTYIDIPDWIPYLGTLTTPSSNIEDDARELANLRLSQAVVGGSTNWSKMTLRDEKGKSKGNSQAQINTLNNMKQYTDEIYDQAKSAPPDDEKNIETTAWMMGQVLNAPANVKLRAELTAFDPKTQAATTTDPNLTPRNVQIDDPKRGPGSGTISTTSTVPATTTTKPVKPASEFTTPPPGIKYKTGDIRTGGFEVDTAADKAIQQQGLQRVAEIQRRAKPAQVGISQPNLETTRKLREADAIVPLKASMTKAIVKEAIGEFFL